MEYSMQPVAGIITLLWDPIARRVKYFTKIEENIDNLGNEVEGLTNSRDDLEREVERAQREGQVPKNEVQGWLQKADKFIKDAEEMQKEFQGSKKCFYGWCLASRYKLGKRINRATQYVQAHRAEKNNFGEIAVPPLSESVQVLPTTTIREATSTRGTLNQVWNWLMDVETRKIGIWGTGGVGKTTLVKNINNKLHGTHHFEVVIFVTVSSDCNMKKLRNDIGEKADLYLSAEEDETRASTSLFNKLKGKRFLLILDDIWERVDLDQLGVPAPEKNSGCKIVITTRDKRVCNEMETDEEIKVEVLSDKEAWELFQEKAGNAISSDLESIARDVCKECHGLPLAISVVGRALRKEIDRKVWEHARQVLQNSEFKLKGMEREVYLPLKFSYENLETDNLRNCFLYCSLFPEDYEIFEDDLIDYWTMEGFIEGVDNLEKASLEGHSLLKELIDSCLLERVREYIVRMHDVIRDMAIKITLESTERGRRFLVRARVGLEECPEVEKWEGKDRISLMENNIRFLPDEPECTELSTLLLQENKLLETIPPSFFRQMKNLRLLDLSHTHVVSLPPSISELGSLQWLDLSRTKIVELPREIGQLIRLRCLNLSWTLELAHIPDIILSLSLLEVLEMWGSSYFGRSNETEAFFEKLLHLNHLTHFSADIPNDLFISSQWEFLLRHKLKTFDLRIGDRDALRNHQVFRYGRHQGLLFTGTTNVSQEAVGLLQYAEILVLHYQNEVRTISAMGARNLNQLKNCLVWNCDKLENVVITDEAEEGIFPELKNLDLFDLQNLRSIWEGNGTPGSFRSTKKITLYRCPNVMHLFSSNVLQLLNSLEELSIDLCDRMVEIVTGEVGNGVIALPRLRRIVLVGLPALNRMWEGVLSLPSLREMIIIECASLRQLAIDIEKTRALEVIRGEREWWDSLEWQNDSSKSHFQNKFTTT